MSPKRRDPENIKAMSYGPLLAYALKITREVARADRSLERLGAKVAAWEAGQIPDETQPGDPAPPLGEHEVATIEALNHADLRDYALRITAIHEEKQSEINRLVARLTKYESAYDSGQGVPSA